MLPEAGSVLRLWEFSLGFTLSLVKKVGLEAGFGLAPEGTSVSLSLGLDSVVT